MLTKLINDYEARVRQLIIENNDLKEFLYEIKTYLNNVNTDENQSRQSQFNDNNILSLPFDSNSEYLNRFIKSKLGCLKQPASFSSHLDEDECDADDEETEHEKPIDESESVNLTNSSKNDTFGTDSQFEVRKYFLREKLRFENEKEGFNRALNQFENEVRPIIMLLKTSYSNLSPFQRESN